MGKSFIPEKLEQLGLDAEVWTVLNSHVKDVWALLPPPKSNLSKYSETPRL